MSNLGLYIHIPFCNSKCDYCDFVSFCLGEKEQLMYLNALCNEIDLYKDKFKNKVFDSLYIGGGTPSVLFDGFIEKLSKKVFDSFHFSLDTEFTIEVNPNSFSEKKFLEYTRACVNRISVGVQCINENVTKNIGRKQSLDNVEHTFEILNKHNFNNISTDIMLAMPNETDKDILNTINFFISHNVKHISAYSLQVEEGTPLYTRVQAGEKMVEEDESRRQYDLVVEKLKNAGYVRYEISNFAIFGYESRHNSKYWNNTEYLGLGVSAHSYYDNMRVFNTSNFNEYITKCNKLKSYKNDIFSVAPIEGYEILDTDTRKMERIMLSLRTSKGLDIVAFDSEFSCDILKNKEQQIKELLKINAIKIEGNHIIITENYVYLANAIIEKFLF